MRLPLRGNHLIEASAGTGKTFTISNIYLRLILGQGAIKTFSPSEVLVVTFTNSASQELKIRIRTRLIKAASFFRQESQSPDRIMTELRDEFDSSQWYKCALKLENAAEKMDESFISTIHSWCQRILCEYTLHSRSSLNQTLKTDHSSLLREIMNDYWRKFCYPLKGVRLKWVSDNWKNPSYLLSKIQDKVDRFQYKESTDYSKIIQKKLSTIISSKLKERRTKIAEIKKPWRRWTEELESIFMEAISKKEINLRKLNPHHFRVWFSKIRTWAADETLEQLEIGIGSKRLTSEGLHGIWKNGIVPNHPALIAMDILEEELEKLPNPDKYVLQHATYWVSTSLEEKKAQRAEINFNDIVIILDKVLQRKEGKKLSRLLRERFPIAIVDEFQDTDPLQYRIFKTIYRDAINSDLHTALFLIGDPKQSIYSFRGASINTYLEARNSIDIHTLDTNFRSSHAMVSAVNHIFERAENRCKGENAFFTPTINKSISFSPVKSKGCKETLQHNLVDITAVNFLISPSDSPLSQKEYYSKLAEICADKIVDLLSESRKRKLGFKSENLAFRQINPSDITIIVRNSEESRFIMQSLSRRKVLSVYHSQKQSVYNTQEAKDLLYWLRACAEPDKPRNIRTALASITFGLSISELKNVNEDEESWELAIEKFQKCYDYWRERGIGSMIFRLLQVFNLVSRIASTLDPTRVLTNLLHLSELLQKSSVELHGEQSLINYLSQKIESSTGTSTSRYFPDEEILRLVSDEDLIQIVTVHKSKGLEYPLTFIPFSSSRKIGVLKRLSVDKSPSSYEALAEDIRVFYVAITRAQHACWIGVADLKEKKSNRSIFHLSSLGYLLMGKVALPASNLLESYLNSLKNKCIAISSNSIAHPEVKYLQSRKQKIMLKEYLEPEKKVVYSHWSISSYSTLRINHQKEYIGSNFSTEKNQYDYLEKYSLHGFPRGLRSGIFLHSLLESLGKNGFDSTPKTIRNFIQLRCKKNCWDERWIDTLYDWLIYFKNQIFNLQDTKNQIELKRIKDYQVEMEFYFESRTVRAQEVDQLISKYTHSGKKRPPIEDRLLNGMFRGFIDLVFEDRGSYYVVDYKSNWLGINNYFYTHENMLNSILENRYDLQYTLYLLALHRHLKVRLKNYSYDKNIGGAICIFLRGLLSEKKGIFFDRPPGHLIQRLDLIFNGN